MTNTILAIDSGKFNGVLCQFNPNPDRPTPQSCLAPLRSYWTD